MSLISVQELFAGPALAAGVSVASVAVTVTDVTGAVQSATLTGVESPPWSTSFTVGAGTGSVSSVQTDSAGNVGTAVTQTYNTSSGAQNLALSGTTVTIVTP